MRPFIRVLLAATALGVALPAAAQQQPSTFGSEISLFGMWDDIREPDNFERTEVNLRYGRYFRPQLVGTVGFQRWRLEADGSDIASTAATIGAKYYVTPPRANAIVPFVDGAIGLAWTKANGDDSTDFTWEFGGGVSWFFTAATSFDAGLHLYQTKTDIETKGTRLFVGVTTRF
jgi:hypothetical protein